MDSLEETELQSLEIEEDDRSLMDDLAEAIRPYAKAWRVHGLASRSNITVFTPKIGPEAKPVIPAPITEDDDFKKLIEEYDAELQTYARRLLRYSRQPEAGAADIVQQSWMKAYRFMQSKRWHSISSDVLGHLSQVPSAWKEGPEEKKHTNNVRAWLYAIVYNNFLEHLRKEKAYPLSYDYDPTNDNRVCDEMDQPEAAFLYKEHVAEIYQALEMLPEQISQVLSLLIQGYTNVEIAEKLSCSPGTVGSHVLRGRKYLRKVLATKKNMRKRMKPAS